MVEISWTINSEAVKWHHQTAIGKNGIINGISKNGNTRVSLDGYCQMGSANGVINGMVKWCWQTGMANGVVKRYRQMVSSNSVINGIMKWCCQTGIIKPVSLNVNY